MTDSYEYTPNPVIYSGNFNLTYTASKILAPVSDYQLLTQNNVTISTFVPTYTFATGTGIYNPSSMEVDSNRYRNYGIYANGLLVESCSQKYMEDLSGMEIMKE